MPATVVLSFFAKELGKRALPALAQEYFGDSKSFEKVMKSEMDALQNTVSVIGEDVAYLRMQTVKDDYIGHLRYFNKELVPFLSLNAKSGFKDTQNLSKHAGEVRQRRLELGADFERGLVVLKERRHTCDFPVRTLFFLLQQIVALKLVYLSWEYLMNREIPGTSETEIPLIRTDYADFKAEAAAAIKEHLEPLCEARLAKIHFESQDKIETDKHGLRSPVYVKYKYEDTFSSKFEGDPFRGDAIKKEEEVERKFYEFGPLADAKARALAQAHGRMMEAKEEHKKHRAEVERLNDLHVRTPTQQFLAELGSLPDVLPEVPLKLNS